MKALVKYDTGYGNMEIRNVPVPGLKKNDVLIKMIAVGICGTDIKILDGHFPVNIPVTIGHEFAGIIEKTGDDVIDWKPGDRVVAEQHVNACGNCFLCLTGKRHLCAQKKAPGYGTDGAFAEYIAVHESLLHRIPDSVSFLEAAVIEPMAVAAYGIFEKTKIQPEDYVVILGCGPIALLALQMLKVQGAAKVILTGIDKDAQNRFKIAKEYGADRTINVQNEDPIKIIMQDTNNKGADVVIDLSGSPDAIVQGFDLIRKDGRFCALGMPNHDFTIPWSKLIFKAANIVFSYSSDYMSWERCLSMISRGSIKMDRYIGNVFRLDDWEQAFALAKSGEAIKVIIQP